MKKQKKGFTLVEIMIVVLIIGLLAAIALPGFARARTRAQENACINNLRQIESAKDQYAMDFGLTTGQSVTLTNLISEEILKSAPSCPVGGEAAYNDTTIGNIGTNPGCGSHNDTNHNVNDRL